MRISALVLPAAVLLLLPGLASAQTGQALITIQLDSAAVLVGGEGYAPMGEIHRGAIAEGEEEAWELDLPGGFDYVMVGVCDEDCSDLDLELADASGSEIDSDYEMDDVPMLFASVQTPGRFRVTVSMPGCSVEPCGYGVRVFALRR